jgi:AcrR family transcriptional regulator
VSGAGGQPADLRILDLALRHLRDFGAARLTIVGLAAELGMSHSNVYRYFPSKAGLLEALTAQWLQPIEAGLRSVCESPDPARDKLERGLSGLHRSYREKLDGDPRLFEVFVSLCRGRSPLARRHRGRVLTELRRSLDEGMAVSAFKADDSGRALTLIIDATYRFTDPIGLSENAEVAYAHAAARLDRVLEAVLNHL